jgi:ABC-type sugar transport system permease subunit
MHVAPSLFSRIWKARRSYILLFPTFAFLLAFNYYPALRGIFYSFQEVQSRGEMGFAGLKNFEKILQDYILLKSVLNLLILLLGNLLKSLILPLFIAVLISRLHSSRIRYLFQSFFLFPIVVPGMVGILLWKGFIFDAQVGLLNNFLEIVGLGRFRHAWLGEHETALASIIFTGFPWVGGIGFLVFLAGLLGISKSVMESALIDGTGPLKKFWSIELPLIMGQIKLVVVLTFIGTIQDFGGILVMTGGGPGAATHVPALHMYYMAFRFDQFGYGAAIGVVLFILILSLTIINMKLIRSRMEE